MRCQRLGIGSAPVAALLLLPLLAGCAVKEEYATEVTFYTHDLTMNLMFGLRFLLAMIGGFLIFMRRTSRRLKYWTAVIGGFLLAICLVPAALQGRVAVYQDRVEISDSVFAFIPNEADVRFKKLSRVETEFEESDLGHEEFLVFVLRDGERVRVKKNLLVRAAERQIVLNVGVYTALGRVPWMRRTPEEELRAMEWMPGTRVEVLAAGDWLPAKVLSTLPDGSMRIQLDGHEEAVAEPVPRDRVRFVAAHPLGFGVEDRMPLMSGDGLTAGMKLEGDRIGQPSPANAFGTEWLPVEVLEVLPDGGIKIRWLTDEPKADEILPPVRLRRLD